TSMFLVDSPTNRPILYALLVMIVARVDPERLLDASRANAMLSLANEAGCSRFDIVHDHSDRTRLWFIEHYDDRAAFDAHLHAPHYLRWKAIATAVRPVGPVTEKLHPWL